MTDAVIVVSGLPRSGTSLMMQMLGAGGITLVTDEKRAADVANPRGYFEYEPVRRLKEEASWLPGLGGRAIKIISLLLEYIPEPCPCKIILMERPLVEILLSQKDMILQLEQSRREEGDFDKSATLLQENQLLRSVYKKHLAALPESFARRQDWEILSVAFADLLNDPQQVIRDLSLFLEKDLPADALAAVVDPSLYRSRL